MCREDKVIPLFKWGGGKRQLLKEILPLIPSFSRYYEPFVGGAAVLFGLCPKKAVVNDVNSELINTYQVVKDNPYELISLLQKYKENHNVEYYYRIRSLDRDSERYSRLSSIEKAARTVYLNRTCFNGLYRVNKAGCFNTPCGKYKNPEIVNKDRIIAMHEFFNSNDIAIRCGDYKDTLKGIRKGAFVYFDPPYMPPENGDETFTEYTVDGFDEDKQIELKEVCDKLTARGVSFMLSNSSCSFIRDLYKDYNIKIVQARRSINANAGKRTLIDEVLVTNF
jgi:DNA adenine methylase